MAVLVEGISVIIKCDTLAKHNHENSLFNTNRYEETYCSDGELLRIGFMSPNEVEGFINTLEVQGYKFMQNDEYFEIAVVDQQRGLMAKCQWLEFGKIAFGEKGKVSACWLFEGPRFGFGIHVKSLKFEMATPVGWEYGGSLSEKFTFIPTIPK